MVATSVDLRDEEALSRGAGAFDAARGILAALNAATIDAHDVRKNGRNRTQHYDYATAEDIIVEAKKHLAAHGLSVLAGSTQLKPGVADAQAILSQQFSLVHKELGDLPLGEREWPIVTSDGRPFDKACAAAHTALLAYFLRDLLQLARTEAGTGLDDDERHDDPRRSVRAGRGRTSKAAKNADDRSRENLVAAIEREFDRLGVPEHMREGESEFLLGREPRVLRDLSQLLWTLRGLHEMKVEVER
jgi:hypothetical protein